MSANNTLKRITIRLEDEEEASGYFEFPAVYAGNNKALAVLNDGIEIHFVEQSGADENVFEYRVSTDPIFNISGYGVEEVLNDLATMTFPEILSKYTLKGLNVWGGR